MADVGTGKTVIGLTSFIQSIPEDEPLLVISTLQIADNTWPDEVDEWEHLHELSVVPITGSPKKRMEALHTHADVYTINVENIVWLMDRIAAGECKDFPHVIVDEMSLWRSLKTRWKKLRRWAHKRETLIGMTGTPTPNSLLNIWPQADLIAPGVLFKQFTKFKFELFVPIDYEQRKWHPRPDSEEWINFRLRDYVFRLEGKEADKPATRYSFPSLLMPKAVKEALKELRNENFWLAHGEYPVSAPSAAVEISKCLQVCNGSVFDDDHQAIHVHDVKLNWVKRYVDDQKGKPTILVYAYTHDRDRLLEAFPQAETIDSPGVVHRWNAGKVPILIMHPASGGHGLNLQMGGNRMVWYGVTYNLEHWEQMIGRLVRRGQPSEVVHVVVPILIDGPEYEVVQALTFKGDVQDAFKRSFKEVA